LDFHYSAARAEMRVRAGSELLFSLQSRFYRRALRPEGLTMAEKEDGATGAGEAEKPKLLSPEARRALAEAEERRRNAIGTSLPREINGPKGPEPIRYGDWERKGIASDF
jgi:hypothetical protein